ncbi:MAG: flagellar biosynthesis anti-sigma factor FlgM [Terracidiphilus sp.]|jgi:flagellar biosynthesis anti-sigma factor FlgM
MTVNFNPTAPGSVVAFLGTHETQAGKNAPLDKQLVELPQDHATISSVGDLVTAALKQPEVRADKVSAIREAIASGTYKVEPHAIASSLLSDQI